MAIPLEDSYADIIGKAMRGTRLDATSVAARAGVTPDDVQQLLAGNFDAEIARRVAPALGLGASQLVALGQGEYQPEPISLDGLAQFNTVFEDMTVNSYLIWDPDSRQAAAFDTGADCSGMLEEIARRQLQLTAIFITHTHGDHIFDLDRLKEKTGARAYVGDKEPALDGAEPFTAGRTWEIGALKVESRLTWGHAQGGITYVVTGLGRTVAVDGDAIFAGSMGGGMVSYADALRTNREEILTLPDDTILCPGHGPLTTVGEQKKHNPFFTA